MNPWIRANEPWRQHCRQIKGRPFEVHSLGSFCLSEHAPSSQENLLDNSLMPTFTSKEELLSQCLYFLENTSYRHSIELKAHQFYLQNYHPDIALPLMERIQTLLVVLHQLHIWRLHRQFPRVTNTALYAVYFRIQVPLQKFCHTFILSNLT